MLQLLVGLTIGRQASKQADDIRVDLEFFKILYRLNYAVFYFVQSTVLELHFSRLLSSKAYLRVCFEVGKIQLPFFHVNPTIRY